MEGNAEIRVDECVIILAAGEARRFGSPKQLAMIDGTPMIRRVCETALASEAANVIVVLGPHAAAIAATIHDLPVHQVINENWSAGIGSSLKLGLEHQIDRFPQTKTTAIMLADQPLIDADHISQLLSTTAIAATSYGRDFGVPAAFNSAFFPQLLALNHEHGAKSVIAANLQNTTLIESPCGAFDVDTPADLDRLRNFIVTKS